MGDQKEERMTPEFLLRKNSGVVPPAEKNSGLSRGNDAGIFRRLLAEKFRRRLSSL